MLATIGALVGRARVGLALVLVGTSCAATWGDAAAQTFPSKPVRLIVPFPPGGTTDTMTRVIATELSDSLGQQVIVDNRPGAGGTLGTEIAAKSPADGHSILLGTISTLAIAPNFYPNLGYDPVGSFAPISLIARLPFFIFVNSSVPAQSLQDLIALARSKPGLLNFASPGNGTLHQLAGETFKKMASVDLVHVPYKGDAAAMTDLVSGQVQVMFDGLGPYRPYVQAGKLKVLAAATPRRHPQLPEVPTAAEAGLPGYEVAAWFGFLAPKGTPAEIVSRFNADVLRALRKSEVREALSMRAIDSGGGSPDEFSALIRDEIAKWSRAVKASGLRPN
jgi:tripartite-type tricarboxylate transporter receptor subunit TctC